MQLSIEQKREFYERGFVIVPGVIPRVMVDAALRAINHSVGEGMDRDEMTRMRSQTYAREIVDTPVITDLFNATPMRDLATSAIGPITPVTGGQVALRFPSMADPPGLPGAHLDGMHSPNNGVPAGQISNFTMLCGVLLSELQEPHSGNFTVYPGTHHMYEDYFRKHTPQSLLDGMPPIDLPEPVQVHAQPGDAVFVHYQVAHTAAQNVSPHTRYAIFFRLKHERHDSLGWEPMTDIWKTWDGMQEIVAERTHGR